MSTFLTFCESLTLVGEDFYQNALVILKHHTDMMNTVRESSSTLKGSIKIMILSVVITVLFVNIISKLIIDRPTINFEILELCAFELRTLLQLNEIDFAVLLQPTGLNPELFNEIELNNDCLNVFTSPDHPLANETKLTWAHVKNYPLATFNDAFMIHHQIHQKFRRMG